VLDETLAGIRLRGERCHETELLRVRGEAHAVQGASVADVERDLQAAIEIATERGARSLRLGAATSLARFRLERGLADDDRTLADALDAVDDDLDQPDVHDARALLALLHPDDVLH
jgi:hypothetical protein